LLSLIEGADEENTLFTGAIYDGLMRSMIRLMENLDLRVNIHEDRYARCKYKVLYLSIVLLKGKERIPRASKRSRNAERTLKSSSILSTLRK